MNRYNFLMLLLSFLLVETASCASDSGGTEAISTGEVNSRWKVFFDGCDSEPVVYDGTIYIGSFDGGIYAIDPKSGNQIWRYQTGEESPRSNVIYTSGESFGEMFGAALDASSKKSKGRREIKATAVIEDGVVYIGSRDHRFYALDAINGKLKWVTDIDHEIFEKAIVTEQHIIVHGYKVGPEDEAFFVLERGNGKIKWTTQGIGSVAPPAFNENKVFYLNEPNNEDERDLIFTANAADVDTGKLLWSITLKGHRPSHPIISENTMYVTAFEGWDRIPRLYAIDIVNGGLAWDFKAEGTTFISSYPPTVGDEFLYYVTETGLFAINKDTGEQAWFLEGLFSPDGIVLDKLLYVQGDSLYAINPKTGKVKWNHSDGNLYNTRLVADTLYMPAKKGMVALNASTGKKLWKFKTAGFFKSGTNISATPLVFKNHVIFPTGTRTFWGEDSIQGHLYSIDVRTGKVK